MSDVSSPGPNFDELHSQAAPQEKSMASSSGHNRADDHRISNLELENKLLRKEVASLNEEMVSVVQRAKEAEKSKRRLVQFYSCKWRKVAPSSEYCMYSSLLSCTCLCSLGGLCRRSVKSFRNACFLFDLIKARWQMFVIDLTNWCQFFMCLSSYWSWISS